ncbi:hypothetical protein C482_11076 [Natrialba chahannaoensis JCM 10990]|uniref:ABC transporter permease n=1 Tax=Natrialba chahannaoensis JCM 10990 TaxID=1227492 RepID=M0ANZ4_9EURY|nr:ABC transporter permease [Natrialba chahannaoensis]ELY99093.1 hypothetical protein C482_11076 [Natrialba chahannaoensis JCM 10990]
MGLLSPFVRTRAVIGIALAQLRRSPGRTVLAVLAVTLSVLAITLLASLGVGVVEVGETGLDNADRDIWVTSDPVDPSANGAENPIPDAHGTSAALTERDDISSAAPLAMHQVYIGTEPDQLERTTAVGVQETHDGFDFEAGSGFDHAELPDEGERPTEPQTAEIVLDPQVAEDAGADVGDTVYVGTSRQTAPEYEFTVVGIASYYSQFLGTPAATVPLPDLQIVAGTTGTDRATFITADVEDGTDQEAVRDDLATEYPEYDVRTSDEQIEAMVAEQPLVLASGMTLVGLAVVGGSVLTINLFALMVTQQRRELAALRAIGLSRGLLSGMIAAQGLVIGLLGGIVGVAATPLLADGLNRVALSLVGFENLLRTPVEVYAAGFALALIVGTVVAGITGWRVGRTLKLEHLEQ